MLASCWTVDLSLFFFFFSSRRRHTRFDCDWSSDVCSSDLALSGGVAPNVIADQAHAEVTIRTVGDTAELRAAIKSAVASVRSEERRVGKECRSRGSPDH